MTSRRSKNHRSLTIEEREHDIALRATTALKEQTRGTFPIYGEEAIQAARHNPFAQLSETGLKAVELIGLATILGIGFGYLVPNVTWPPSTEHLLGLAVVALSCAASVLASSRRAENNVRLISAAQKWKIGDGGIFISSTTSGNEKIAIDHVPWADVSVAESHHGRVVLIRSDGTIIADLNNPAQAQGILDEVQQQRARRGEANPGEVRGTRVEPRFDFAERDTAEIMRPYSLHTPIDLDEAMAPVSRRDEHTIRIEPPRLETEDADIVDADFTDVIIESVAEFVTDPILPKSSPYEIETVEQNLRETTPEITQRPFNVADYDWSSAVLNDDTIALAYVTEAQPTFDEEAVQRGIEESIRHLFEPIEAKVVPPQVQESQDATTRPVPITKGPILADNEDSTADADKAILDRLVKTLTQTAVDSGLDPHTFVAENVALYLAKKAERAANSIMQPMVKKVA